MKSSSRLLIIFGAAIAALVIIAIILVLALPAKPVSLLAESTPEGIVQRFFLALQNEDYAKAYSYLDQTSNNKMTYEMWREGQNRSPEKISWKVTIGTAKINDKEATVEVIVDKFRPQGPFSDPIETNRMNFTLNKNDSGWVITYPLDLWWLNY